MEIINSENGIEILSRDLSYNSNGGFIAVDTEFIRERGQIPLLFLIQIATENEVYVIDPISVEIGFLKPFFANENVKKVFHSAKQDIEILQNYGFEINNVHDTQLYEMVLSPKENISYQSIVFHYLGKKLKKRYGLSDWSRRPLNKKQLDYSSEDVSYLRKVYEKQKELLKLLNRENWLDEEITLLTKNSCNPLEESIPEENLEILYKLVKWREQKAKENKFVPELFVSDRLIKSICKKRSEFIKNLKNSRNFEDVNMQEFLNYAEKLVENIHYEKTTPKKIAEVGLLKVLLNLKSEENNVAPSIIASTKDLDHFISGGEGVKFLQGWRQEIFGRFAKQLLDGKMRLGIQNNRAILYE